MTAAGFFDRVRRAEAVAVRSADGMDPLDVDVPRGHADVDEVDEMLVARCRPPVLDVGCGL